MMASKIVGFLLVSIATGERMLRFLRIEGQVSVFFKTSLIQKPVIENL